MRRGSGKQSRTKKGLWLTRWILDDDDDHRHLCQERWLWAGGGEGSGEIYKSRETRGDSETGFGA